MGPLTPFFPSLTNFPKCPPPPLQTHSASQERATHPPLRGAHKGHHHHPPSRPSRAGGRGQELKGGVRKVLGCSSPRTHTRIYYPLSTSPHPPTPTWLVSARGVGGGQEGRWPDRAGGGQEKHVVTSSLSRAVDKRRRGRGRGRQNALFQLLCKIKNALQSRASPQPISKSSWPGGGLSIVLGARGDCGPRRRGVSVRPAAVPAGGRRAPGGRSRAGRGRGEARRGPGEAGPPPPPAPGLPRRARSSVCLLAGGSRTRGACKHSDTRFFPIKIHFHFF